MTAALPLAALALALLASGKKKSSVPRAETPAELAARIVREGQEIVRGKRDAFTDATPEQTAPKPVAPALSSPTSTSPKPVAPKPSTPSAPRPAPDELDAVVRAAVEQADRDAASAVAPKPAPKPAPKFNAKPAPKPAPKPVASSPAPIFVRPPVPVQPAPQAVVSPPLGPPIPAGYDPTAARRMAPALARHLKNKGRAGYDRTLVKSFQTKSGIEPDRIYGGATRGALLHYGATPGETPAPFFPPLQTIPYVPPEQRTTAP